MSSDHGERGEPRYDVVWPLGPIRQGRVEAAESHSGFGGHRVAFVWDWLFRGPEMFSIIETEWRKADPTTEFIDYEVFGSIGGSGRCDDTTRYNPSSPYSASKAAADHIVRAWHRTYDMPVVLSSCGNNTSWSLMPTFDSGESAPRMLTRTG